jgi:hypothetical protein
MLDPMMISRPAFCTGRFLSWLTNAIVFWADEPLLAAKIGMR